MAYCGTANLHADVTSNFTMDLAAVAIHCGCKSNTFSKLYILDQQLGVKGKPVPMWAISGQLFSAFQLFSIANNVPGAISGRALFLMGDSCHSLMCFKLTMQESIFKIS